MSGCRTTPPISEVGVSIAATRIGITAEEYRQHEADGERWCPRCSSWMPRFGQAYCRDCFNDYQFERRHGEARQIS